MHVEWETPISVPYDFCLWNQKNATLYVPAGSKAAYEAADYWKEFKEIVEMAQVTKFAVEQGKTYTSGQRFDFDNISLTIGEAGDANGDGEINITDITLVLDIINSAR